MSTRDGWRYAITLTMVVTMIGGGCASSRAVPPSPSTILQTQTAGADAPAVVREVVADGLVHVTYRFGPTPDESMDLFGFNPKRFEFSLNVTSTRFTMKRWGELDPAAVAIMNGGYFMDDGSPSGFVVRHGVRIGTAQFDADKSAIIDFTDGVRIVTATSSLRDRSKYQTALQSYPVLMASGTPRVKSDSGKVARRSIIGVDADGMVWMGVVPEAEISLYTLSQMLDQTKISWVDVVNVDGGPSTGLLVRSGKTAWLHETVFGVPFVVTATPRL